MDKLSSENSKLQEELLLMKKDNEFNTKSDTQKADIRDKYNTLLQENKALRQQIEAKFSQERFEME